MTKNLIRKFDHNLINYLRNINKLNRVLSYILNFIFYIVRLHFSPFIKAAAHPIIIINKKLLY